MQDNYNHTKPHHNLFMVLQFAGKARLQEIIMLTILYLHRYVDYRYTTARADIECVMQ